MLNRSFFRFAFGFIGIIAASVILILVTGAFDGADIASGGE
jgi:hypothetical protein